MTKKQKTENDRVPEPAEAAEESDSIEQADGAAAVDSGGATPESDSEEAAARETHETPEAQEAEEAPELEKARAEAAEMKRHYLRSVADLENFRKRMAREKQEIIRSASASVIESILPVLDNLRLGLQAAENHPEAKDVTTGFQMVEDQLKRVLEEQGLEELKPDGAPFDPNFHECLSHQASDTVPEDHVIQTIRSGYRLNERLIRAANVIVSSGAAARDDSGSGQENE